MHERTRFFLPILAPAVVLGALALAAGIDVLAEHIPGATYSGTHQGGGEVEFEVSADGSGIQSFTAKDVPGVPSCAFGEIGLTFDPPLAITGHQFSKQSSSGLSISGNFPQAGQAQGTLRARQMAIPPHVPGCDSSELTWTATTGIPSPSPTPSSTPSPTPSPSPSPTGTPGPLKKGDVDCDGSVGSVDALKVLRHVASLFVPQNDPCPDIGTEANSIFGDMDCNDSVTSVDALRILRFVAAMTTGVPQGCLPIGQ